MGMFVQAMVNLKIPQGPGVIPSSIKVPAGQVVELDGTEPIDVEGLINRGAIRRVTRKKKANG